MFSPQNMRKGTRTEGVDPILADIDCLTRFECLGTEAQFDPQAIEQSAQRDRRGAQLQFWRRAGAHQFAQQPFQNGSILAVSSIMNLAYLARVRNHAPEDHPNIEKLRI